MKHPGDFAMLIIVFLVLGTLGGLVVADIVHDVLPVTTEG